MHPSLSHMSSAFPGHRISPAGSLRAVGCPQGGLRWSQRALADEPRAAFLFIRLLPRLRVDPTTAGHSGAFPTLLYLDDGWAPHIAVTFVLTPSLLPPCECLSRSGFLHHLRRRRWAPPSPLLSLTPLPLRVTVGFASAFFIHRRRCFFLDCLISLLCLCVIFAYGRYGCSSVSVLWI
jgi:hypothetical protein